jgi:peptidoglycan/xylan/chitin deacetylase (PgdA/CDA1 family)
VPVTAFVEHLDAITASKVAVLSLDDALDRLDARSDEPAVVLTFDDGFAEVHEVAGPLLIDRGLPFVVYVAAGLVGGTMRWEGSVAASQGARAVTWSQLRDLAASGLCTIGNHTWSHAEPTVVDADELRRCSEAIESELGQSPRHFAYTWGVPVPRIDAIVRDSFRSAVTGVIGRNHPGTDRHGLRRVPVRRTDPLPFVKAKVEGSLVGERSYAVLARSVKRLRR